MNRLPAPVAGGRAEEPNKSVSAARWSIAIRYATLSGANLAAMGLGFAVMLIIVRRFGVVELGRVALAQSVLGYVLTIGLWGTDLFAIQRVAARPSVLGATVRIVRRVRLAASLLAYSGVVSVCFLVPSMQDVAPLVALFALSVFAAALSPEWVPQAQHKTWVTGTATLTTQLVYLGLVVAVSVVGIGVWGVAGAKAVADFAVMGALLLWLKGNAVTAAASPSALEVRRFASAAAPICATQLLRSIALSSDVVVLGLLASRVTLGHYAGASRLFMLLLSLATAYFVILLPRFAERGAQSTSALAHELRSSLRRTVPLAGILVTGCALLADPVLSLLFGSDFATAAVALRFLTLAAAANLVGRHYRQVLLVRRRQATDFRLTVAGAAVHVTSKVALIPWLGMTGAALGTLLGEVFLMVAHRRAAMRVLGMPWTLERDQEGHTDEPTQRVRVRDETDE